MCYVFLGFDGLTFHTIEMDEFSIVSFGKAIELYIRYLCFSKGVDIRRDSFVDYKGFSKLLSQINEKLEKLKEQTLPSNDLREIYSYRSKLVHGEELRPDRINMEKIRLAAKEFLFEKLLRDRVKINKSYDLFWVLWNSL